MEVRQLAVAFPSLLRACVALAWLAAAAATAGSLCNTAGRPRTPRLGTHRPLDGLDHSVSHISVSEPRVYKDENKKLNY